MTKNSLQGFRVAQRPRSPKIVFGTLATNRSLRLSNHGNSLNVFGELDGQVSEKGLYHLGNDICNFNVPEFICEQQLRIRTKIHNKKNKKGYCDLSVIVACQPKNIKDLVISNYSLDDETKLPLIFE